MLKWNVDPCFFPGEVAHMLPPIASTNRLQMAKPKPDPPCCLVLEESTCIMYKAHSSYVIIETIAIMTVLIV